MAHYIGDVCQYGHSIPSEAHHSDSEGWVAQRTASFNGGTFESYIALDSLVRRSAYTAVKRISLATARGNGDIISACGGVRGADRTQGRGSTTALGISLAGLEFPIDRITWRSSRGAGRPPCWSMTLGN